MAATHERLTTQDRSFVLFEQRATHMHVGALAILEAGPLRAASGGIDAERIARYVEARLGGLPHYRHKLAFAPLSAHPSWVDDEHFDLDYHVRHTALPGAAGETELKALAARILSQPLDRDRPLWEMWVIERLAGDRFALLMKVHHCMVDGASGMTLLGHLLRAEPSEEIPPAEAWFPRPPPHPARLLVDELAERARVPSRAWRELLAAARDPQAALGAARARAGAVVEALRSGLHLPSDTSLNRPIGPHRRVEWRRFELAELKEIRKRLGGTVNDVVLALVAGALHRFLARRREPLESLDYRVVVPVDMRSASGDPGVANRVSAFFLSLPVADRDPLARYEKVRAECERSKKSHVADGIDFFTRLVERSGSSWLAVAGVRLAARVQPYNQTVSNVPGPQLPLYLLGAKLLELYPLAPLFERQDLATAVLSYDGGVCFGLVADRDSVPDLAALARDLDAAYAELRTAAQQPKPRAARKVRATRGARRASSPSASPAAPAAGPPPARTP